MENGTDGNTVGPAEIGGEAVDRLIGWCMTYLVNFTGNPAASSPAGLTESNLPVGMQIVGGATPTPTCWPPAPVSSG